MTRIKKVLGRVLAGVSDANIIFKDLLVLLEKLNFDLRIRGSHYIFTRDDVEEIVNLQEKGGKAKPYQVKQIRNIILKYHLNTQLYESE